MRNIISCRKIDKKLILLIIGVIGSFYLSRLCFDLFSKDKSKYIEKEYKENNRLLKSFLKYFGFCFAIIGEIIRSKTSTNREESPKNMINKKDIFYIALISIMILINEFLAIYLKLDDNLTTVSLDENHNAIEFLLLFLCSKFIFNKIYYKHQYIAILFVILMELIRMIIRINSDLDKNINDAGYILSFFIKLITTILDSIFFGYSLILIEKKYFSPYKALYIFGIICFIFTFLVYIIISFIPVGNNKFCKIQKGDQCYFDDFFSVFENFTFVQFITLFSHSIFIAAVQLILNFLGHFYTICHISIFYLFNSGYIMINSDFHFEEFSIFEKIILIISYILEVLLTLVFLEMIILNVFGLGYNTKEQIESRATSDVEFEISDGSSSFDVDNQYVTKFSDSENTDTKENTNNDSDYLYGQN